MLKVNIENFQSIHSASFNINGFTVLVGENDIGKSSSFRAIHSLFNNRSGDAFITLNKPYSRVSCSFEDKCITWSKHRKSGASYTLSVGDKSQDYDKVGRNTPDFMNELGFGEISLKSGKIDPHFSRQREEPFLVSSSGSKQILTEFFSELLKFGTLGKAVIQVAKDIRKVNTDINVLEKQKDLQNGIIERFPDTGEIASAITRIEELNSDLENADNSLSLLEEYLSMPSIPDEIPDFQLDFTKSVNDLKYNQIKLTRIEEYLNLPKVDYSTFDIPDYARELNYLSFLSSCLRLSNIHIPEYSNKDISYLEFLKKCMDIKDFEKAKTEMETRVLKAERDFKSALEEFGVCPLCERQSEHV